MAQRSKKGSRKLVLTVDLARVFNRIMTDKSPAVRRVLRGRLTDISVKRAFALNAIELITKRTQGGKDYNGQAFAKYSKSYKESTQFKIYGKSATKVNLRLSGEMLASMVSKARAGTSIALEFIDADNNNKAHGHTFGGGVKNSLPIRDFFNLTTAEEDELLSDILREGSTEEDVNALADFFTLALEDIL
jgi:hypothetical protein